MKRVGLIGYGYWGPNLLRNLMENQLAEVVFCCDLDKKKLERVRTRYPEITLTTRFDEVIRSPFIDAVLIATPVSTHFPLAKKALLAGKDVFIEKPITASVKEANDLIRLRKKQKRIVMVGHTFEYAPPVLKIKELISSGTLGQIYFISSTRVNLGIHQKDISVIWDLAPHDFSIIFALLDEEPLRIQALARDCVKTKFPDVAFINMKFPSGVIAHMEISWLAPTKLRYFTIVGSKKMLTYDDTEAVEKIKIFDHGVNFKDPESFGEYQLSYRTGDIVSPKLATHEPLGTELGHFIECITDRKTPRTSDYSGLRVVRALELSEKSLSRRK